MNETGPDRTGYLNMEAGKTETEDKTEGVSEGKTFERMLFEKKLWFVLKLQLIVMVSISFNSK